MRKTLTINISGIVFYIEDNAFEVLRSYLNKLKAYFGKQSDGDEIIADIESRIAELFQEDLASKTEAIQIELVQKVIEQLGTPKDFIEDEDYEKSEEDSEDTSGSQTQSRPSFRPGNKKLFRDPDKRVFGGVCSGLAYYFGMDLVIVRIIFTIILIATSGGWGLIYLVLWIAVPEAISAGQRLEMQGKAVNVDNIKDNFSKKKKGSHTEKSTEKDADGSDASNDSNDNDPEKGSAGYNKSSNYSHKRPTIKVKPGKGYVYKKKGNNFADFLLSMIKVFFIFIGSIVLVSLLIALFAVLISAFAISGVMPVDSVCFNDLQLLPEVFLSYNGSGFLGVVLVIGIPIFLLVYLITKLAFKHQGKTGWVIVISFILWFIGFGLILRTGIGIISEGPEALRDIDENWKNRIETIFGEFDEEWGDDRIQTAETNFTIVSDTLFVNLSAYDTINFKSNRGNYMKIEGQNMYLGVPKIHLHATSGSSTCTVIQKTREGNNNTSEAYFPVSLKNDTLHLPLHYSFQGFSSKPSVDVKLKLPENKVFYIIPGKGTENLKSVIWSGESEVKFKEIPGKYLITNKDGISVSR